MTKISVILPAAGSSQRFQDKNYKKPFAPLAGKAVWLHSAEKFLARKDVHQLIVVIAEEDREEFNRKYGANIAILGVEVCLGGAERADSIENALANVKDDTDMIVVHDAARPCLADKWLDAVFETAARDGAAILATPITSTIKKVDAENRIESTVDRRQLWEAQTPQVYRRQLLIDAYAARAGEAVTDDACLVEKLGEKISIVVSSPLNIKITTRDDLKLAEQILKVLPKPKGDFSNPFANDDLWK